MKAGRLPFLVAAAMLLIAMAAPPAHARRVALVIGNSACAQGPE